MKQTHGSGRTLKYCAYSTFQNSFFQVAVFIMIAFPIMCVLAKESPFSSRFLPLTVLVLFFFAFFVVLFLRANKQYERILITEDKIIILFPDHEQIEIPWSDSISIGAFSGTGMMQRTLEAPGRTWYELILSSEELSYAFLADQIFHFSREKYRGGGSWKVSLGRGTKKWCQAQIDAIEQLKAEALR